MAALFGNGPNAVRIMQASWAASKKPPIQEQRNALLKAAEQHPEPQEKANLIFFIKHMAPNWWIRKWWNRFNAPLGSSQDIDYFTQVYRGYTPAQSMLLSLGTWIVAGVSIIGLIGLGAGLMWWFSK
jgi:hypothetical protein